MERVRLQKYLADAGIASRRKAEKLIEQGRVFVNGNVVKKPGTSISKCDVVYFDGKKIENKNKYIYIMLNKPSGYITTVRDQFKRKNVLELLEKINFRVYPVGRLDYKTKGLLILTNDGDLTYKLTHPSHKIEKTYIAGVMGKVLEKDLALLRKGVDIGGYITAPAKVSLIENDGSRTLIQIVIHEGKNRQVRKMCKAVGYNVLSLKRIAIGNLRLGDLKEGKWRYLSHKEISLLGK